MKNLLLIACFLFLVFSCKQRPPLPDYGHATIPGQYVNQLGQTVDSTMIENKVAIVDFVFTHCPSICPKMAAQMLRVQEQFGHREDLQIVSFSIDPKNDTVERLRYYTDKIGVDDSLWYFVRADKATIDETAHSLKVFQEEDDSAPGGYNHQSRFILIDQKGDVRGYYNGVDARDVDKMMEDMKQLF